MANLITFRIREPSARRGLSAAVRDFSGRAKQVPGALKQELAGRTGVMRRGPGSVDEQFRRQATVSRSGVRTWEKTKDFGTRKAPARTLKRTGAYLAAWRGEGAGSVTRVSGNRVQIGVDSSRFPQVHVFQKTRDTRIRVTPKMRSFLGLTYGVWLRGDTTHIVIPPRRFAVNARMVSRAGDVVVRFVATGKKRVA